ncbi:MAG: hypothetical protein MI975_01585 [Cytophagales bacterium]|nr:hypothetical protein [Cytophagales bacterium]
MSGTSKKIMSIDNMRVGKNYFIKNHGETTSFSVLATSGVNDFKIKDLLSLEIYQFGRLIEFGIGEDFELYEI